MCSGWAVRVSTWSGSQGALGCGMVSGSGVEDGGQGAEDGGQTAEDSWREDPRA